MKQILCTSGLVKTKFESKHFNQPINAHFVPSSLLGLKHVSSNATIWTFYYSEVLKCSENSIEGPHTLKISTLLYWGASFNNKTRVSMLRPMSQIWDPGLNKTDKDLGNSIGSES